MSNVSPNATLNRILRFELDVVFDAGLAVGRGAVGNVLEVARDGRGRPYLPGASIAGVLRAAYGKGREPRDVDRFFGATVESVQSELASTLEPSMLIAEDAVLDLGKGAVESRTSHLRCRHTGRVAEGALYSYEATPPGAKATLRFTLFEPTCDADEDASNEFVQTCVGLFKRGLFFGGSSNRGVGLARVADVRARVYRTNLPDEYAKYLNDDYALRRGESVDWNATPETEELRKFELPKDETLRLEWTFTIPRGQDLLVADGQGLESTQEPCYALGADGKFYWRLPGSSIRGLLRSYALRLAAREGLGVADSVETFDAARRTTDPNRIAWLGNENAKDDDAFLEALPEAYPIEEMFGSLHKAGRFRLADAYSPIGLKNADPWTFDELAKDPKFPVQKRMHVALDALSGGAFDGLLFDNYVLTSGSPNPVEFKVVALLERPSDDQARVLAQALRAIHLGVLRVGSSKASGRMEISNFRALGVEALAQYFNGVDAPLDDAVGEDMAEPFAEDSVSTEAETESVDEQDDSLPGVLIVETNKKQQKIFKLKYVNLKGKELTASIPPSAQLFEDGDAVDGQDVRVKLEKGLISEVWIPGKTKRSVGVAPSRSSGKTLGGARQNTPVNVNSLPQGTPSLLGNPFYNPYTFVPFGSGSKRDKPAFQTKDELEKERFTGVLEIELESRTPSLFRGCDTVDPDAVQKSYPAQKIDDDVVVPATSVRGFLRYLTTVVTGGPLTTMERETYLCQGRDLPLPKQEDKQRGAKPILARVIQPGNSMRAGRVAVGVTKLVSFDRLEKLCPDIKRPQTNNVTYYWAEYDPDALNRDECVRSVSERKDSRHTAQIKLAGRPVQKLKGAAVKLEGVFVDELAEIELPPEYWQAYTSRWKYGCRPELKAEDLVWIQPRDPMARPQDIQESDDIVCLQWARWGRGGTRVDELMPNDLVPDALRDDLVATSTDLFGQVRGRGDERAESFKGRVAPENLVFKSGDYQLEQDVSLAVMSGPHLGCVPFYRKNSDSKSISQKDPLRGYKVYRVDAGTTHGREPWRYETQGVYGEDGRLTDAQRVNFRADLVKSSARGVVRVAVRALTSDELALALAVCRAPWRLGGGKPLGLGLLVPTRVVLRDESGNEVDQTEVDALKPDWAKRLAMWVKTQRPLENVRYPRAVNRNRNKNTRGGMTWFQKNATIKKGDQGGVQPTYVCGSLMDSVRATGVDNHVHGDAELVSGQTLPFVPDAPEKELLYGYDLIYDDASRSEVFFNRNDQMCYPFLETFDEEKHIDGTEKSGENLSPNRESRQAIHADRAEQNYRFKKR